MKMLTPNGDLCETPNENVQEAIAAGFKPMDDKAMSSLYQSYAMAGHRFEADWKKSHKAFKLPRGRGRW